MSQSHEPLCSVADAAHAGFEVARRRVRRVLIVDEHPLVWQGLRHVIQFEDDLTVCGEAGTAGAAIAAILQLKPDILICGIGQQGSDGTDFVRYVRAHHPRLPILIFSPQGETIYAERMLAVGARGFISKQATSDELLASLRQVLDGRIYVSADMSADLIESYAFAGSRRASPLERLSERELQVLSMIGQGLSTREAADSLNLSIKTVESHRQRIKRKLNLSTSIQLVRYAILVAARPAAQ